MSFRIRWSDKRRRINDHVSPVIKAIVIFNHVPLQFIEARVWMAVSCGRFGLIIKVGYDLGMSWVSRRRRVAKRSECCIRIQITAQVRHTLPRKDTEYISLVLGEL